MGKNTKKLITICAVCVLLLSMAVPTALAATDKSTATVDLGSSRMAYGGERTLYALGLTGTVQSQSANTNTIKGYMYTKGILWTHMRDSETTSIMQSAGLSWANANGDTGKYWAQCQAEKGNHAGYCVVEHVDP